MTDNASNPYGFDDDVDDDLWRQSNASRGGIGGHANFADHADAAQIHVAANGGEECPGCGKVHTIPKAFSSMPRQLHSLTAKLLDGFDHGNISTINAQSVPVSLQLMASMMSFTNDVQRSYIDTPTVRAVAEILDEITEGKVTAKVGLYASERDLRSAHFTCKTINDFVEFVRTDALGLFNRSEDQNYLPVIEHVLGYHAAMRDAAILAYTTQCTIAAVDPDQDLIDNGRHTKGSPAALANKNYFRRFFADATE